MYGIFTYIWLISMVNVGKYTSPMDGMGLGFSYILVCPDGLCRRLLSEALKIGTGWPALWDCLGCIGDEILPKYIGIIVNHEIRIPIKQPL